MRWPRESSPRRGLEGRCSSGAGRGNGPVIELGPTRGDTESVRDEAESRLRAEAAGKGVRQPWGVKQAMRAALKGAQCHYVTVCREIGRKLTGQLIGRSTERPVHQQANEESGRPGGVRRLAIKYETRDNG